MSLARLPGATIALTLAAAGLLALLTLSPGLATRTDWEAAAGTRDVALLSLIAAGLALAARLARRDAALYRGLAERIERLVVLLAAHPGRAVAVATALLGLAALERGGVLVFDEWANLWQAIAFSRGQLVGHTPPDLLARIVSPGEAGYFFRVDRASGDWLSIYWPGTAAAIAPLAALGVPLLAGPLAAGVALMALVSLVRRELGREAVGAALAATLASGAFVLTATTLLPAGFELAAHLVLAACLARGDRRGALAGGLGGSFSLIGHNPVPALAFMGPWVLWLLARRDRRLIPFAFGLLPGIAIFVGWALLWGTVGAADPSNPSSWGERLGEYVALPTTGMLLARAAELARLVAWSAPGLPLLAIAGWRMTRERPYLRLLGLSALVTLLAYLPYPASQGFGWGARYFHAAWAALPVLAAAALAGADPALRRRALVAFAIGALVVLPAGLRIASHGGAEADPFRPHFEQGADLVIAAGDSVLIDAARFRNDPGLRGPLVLAGLDDVSDAALMARHFPEARELVRGPWGVAYRRGPFVP